MPINEAKLIINIIQIKGLFLYIKNRKSASISDKTSPDLLKLKNYVNLQLKKGYSEDAIKQSLIKKNWRGRYIGHIG